MHGETDLIVKPAQSKRFKKAWGKRDGLTYIELDNQDHNLRNGEARLNVLRNSLQFLGTHLPVN